MSEDMELDENEYPGEHLYPLSLECPHCDGTGDLCEDDVSVSCPWCQGTGLEDPPDEDEEP